MVKSAFEAALQSLPKTADLDMEWDWIRSHEALSRRARSDREEKVLLTEDDILHAANGPAPSMSAAIELQNWVNNPNEFYKQLRAVRIKQPRSRTVESGEEPECDVKEELKSLVS